MDKSNPGKKIQTTCDQLTGPQEGLVIPANFYIAGTQATSCRILGLTALNSLLQYVNWLVWEVCSVN